MANECVLMAETELPINFKCADGTGIEKGAILKLTESMTAVITSGQGDNVAGIAAEEKIANDGKTTIKVYMGGIFKGTAGAAVAIGAGLMTDATPNLLETTTGVSGASQLGYAMEAPSGINQTFLFRLNPGGSGAIA